jgi:hypothetical protein
MTASPGTKRLVGRAAARDEQDFVFVLALADLNLRRHVVLVFFSSNMEMAVSCE